jgi:putative phosphotransacetylase
MAEKFIVETSARHVHVTKEVLETLFGKGPSCIIKKNFPSPDSMHVKNGWIWSARRAR